DGPAIRIDIGDAVEGHRIGAVPAVLREILLGVSLETLLILGGSEAIRDALPVRGVGVHARSGPAGGEVGDRVIAFQAEAVRGVHRGYGRRAAHGRAREANKQSDSQKSGGGHAHWRGFAESRHCRSPSVESSSSQKVWVRRTESSLSTALS